MILSLNNNEQRQTFRMIGLLGRQYSGLIWIRKCAIFVQNSIWSGAAEPGGQYAVDPSQNWIPLYSKISMKYHQFLYTYKSFSKPINVLARLGLHSKKVIFHKFTLTTAVFNFESRLTCWLRYNLALLDRRPFCVYFKKFPLLDFRKVHFPFQGIVPVRATLNTK